MPVSLRSQAAALAALLVLLLPPTPVSAFPSSTVPGAAWRARGPGGAPQCASLSTPYMLRADNKLSPSLGTSLTPSLAWAVPVSQASVDTVRVQVFSLGGSLSLYDSGEVPAGAPGASQWGLVYPTTAPALAAGTPYTWRVTTRAGGGGGGAWTPWSTNATLVTGLWMGSDWAPSVEPIWAPNASAQFVLLRGALALPPLAARTIVGAFAFATAQPQRSLPDHENGKLLGAYKLWLDGALTGLGPGRPGRCGPVCPVSGSPGNCSCAPEHVYDVLDVTASVAAASASGAAQMALALACFAAPGPDAARVLLQVLVHYSDGSVVSGGTRVGGSWSALDATPWMAPSCCTERAWFYGPQENWDARLEPIGWSLPGFVPSPPQWQPAAAAGPFEAPLVPRPTLSLAVTEGLAPAAVEDRTTAAGLRARVYDMGRELQGGMALEFPPDTPSGAPYALQLGEELLDDGTVRFEMRTGNNYSGLVTARAGGGAVAGTHEYMEFRYVQVVALDSGVAPVPCAASASMDYTTPLTLSCGGEGRSMQEFTFASWGAPSGSCAPDGSNDFAVNASCNYDHTRDVLTPLCVGRESCTFVPSDALFGGADPCDKTPKRLAAAWTCAGPPPPPPPPPAPLPAATAWAVFYPASFIADASDVCDGGAAGTGVSGGSTGAGAFTSSSPELNAVFELCEYTTRAVNLDVVTDSNTRQRSPVCAEAMLATNLDQGAASYETASQAYLTEYVLNGSPGGAGWAEWQALLISSVHALWLATGDTSQYTAHAPLLRAYLERELFNSSTGLWTCDAAGSWSCGKPEWDWPVGMRDGVVMERASTLVNAHYVGVLLEYAALAAAVGDTASAATARAQSAALAAAMRTQLFNASTGEFVDGLGTHHSAIHASVYAAARGVAAGDSAVGDALWRTLLARLDPVAGIPVGPYPALFYGEALFANTSDFGHAAVSRFLLNNGTNSWLSQLRQGATTTMESWTPEEKANLTWSHPWMALALQLIARWLLGVRAVAAGAAAIVIQPQPGPLPWGSGAVPTVRGPVTVAWAQELAGGGSGAMPTRFALNVTVPGAVSARVCLPLSACGPAAAVALDGATVQGDVDGVYACVAAVPAGAHQLACPAV